jgi:hypothetical protein
MNVYKSLGILYFIRTIILQTHTQTDGLLLLLNHTSLLYLIVLAWLNKLK